MFLTLWLTLAHAADTCPAGQVIEQDTLGHCCWSGQAWNGQVCAGLPLSCPPGTRVETRTRACVSEACPEGQENLDGLHCCWPGQTWSAESEACAGTPSCPPGYASLGDLGCSHGGSGGLMGARTWSPVVDPARAADCPAGEQLAADDLHCCPPGHAWSSTRGRCVAPPVSSLPTGPAPVKSTQPQGSFGSTSGATVAVGLPVILGALDKSLIDAVIRRNLAQIRYCYQRELVKNPDLSGKIVVRFVITQDGSVRSAETQSTTMNNARVEDCINGRFLRFVFPEPQGGGTVIASYPFTFEPGTTP